jgi:hypothetical protein
VTVLRANFGIVSCLCPARPIPCIHCCSEGSHRVVLCVYVCVRDCQRVLENTNTRPSNQAMRPGTLDNK